LRLQPVGGVDTGDAGADDQDIVVGHDRDRDGEDDKMLDR
jgi:hypothetical protein